MEQISDFQPYDDESIISFLTRIKENNLIDVEYVFEKFIVQRLSEIDDTMEDGMTPLLYAVNQGMTGVAKVLINYGAKLDFVLNSSVSQSEMQAIHVAAKQGHREICSLLLARGVSINVKDSAGFTPLMWSISPNQDLNHSVFSFLIQRNCELNSQDAGELTALHWAAICGQLDTCKILLENGAAADIVDKDGTHAIHRAAQNGHILIVDLFLHKGESIDKIDANGFTPLMWSVSPDLDNSLLQFLLKRNASVNMTDNSGMTALHWAASYGKLETCRMLLEHGADISCEQNVPACEAAAGGDQGMTPLHWAAKNRRTEVCRLFIAHGVDSTACDCQGRRAVDLVPADEQDEVAQELRLLLENAETDQIADRNLK